MVGIGGMGRVYCAEQVALGRTVAVKVVHPHLADDELAAARFLNEARTASRLSHPNSVAIFDFGRTEQGQPYIVMEYLRGRDLGRVAHDEGPLPIRRITDVLRQTLAALEEAHALGIVHRDLKPSNLFLTKRPDGSALVKVLDFGVAKLLNNDPSKPALTANGAVIGSPVYMSPEQLLGKKTVDARSDVWQLGVILHELLTGDCPFDGRTMAEIMLAIGVQPAKPLRQLRPDAPAELEALVLRCLEKDADKRLPDVAALAEGLLPFASNRRAHVSVEHIVTLIRGAQAAAALPPMRASMQSGASFMSDRLSEVPGGVQVTTKEPSNPFQQTIVSPQGTAPSQPAAAQAAPAPPADSRFAQTTPGQAQIQAANRSSMVQWVIAGVLILLGIVAVGWGFASRSQGPAPKPTPAAPAAK